MQVAKFELLIILLNLSHNTIDSVRNDLVLTVNEQNEATALGDVTLPVSKSTTSFQRLEDLEKAIYLLAEDFEKFKRHSSCFRTVANRLKHKLHNHIHRQIKHADRAETSFAHSHVHRSPGVPMGPESRPSSRLSRRALRDDDPAPGHGLDGVPGLDGAPGLDGVPGLDGRNGKDGKDGRDGRDGKDGQAGERGPPGVPGPPGEQGKRGKQGPPGKVGAAGPAGVCAYRAKFDCGLLATNGSGQVAGSALLMAPTMIGGSAGDVSTHNGDQSGEERQVTVSEGDNIQLSCEAFALPKPQYVWQRSDRKTAIILDSESDFHVSSYPGSQLPLVNVDRSQAGSYECIASNGVPPSASKRVTLNVNYAPTIHIYPGPSVYRVQFGSSIQLECIVEANPSSFTYWTFGSALLMSVPITQSQQQAVNGVGGSGGDLLVEQQPEKASSQLDKKYIITESAGELTTGASFNIMTLNITNLQRTDLGLYKCISKNLIGQSEGYIWLESSLDDSAAVASSSPEDRNYRELILEQSWQQQQPLDRTSGWPSRLLERKGNYSTFGSVRRRSFRKPTSASGLSSLIKRPQVAIPGGQPDHTGDVDDDKLLVSPDLQLNRDSSPLSTISPNSGSSIDGNSGSSSNESVGRLSTKSETTTAATSTLIEETDTGRQQSDDLTDETELCRSEKLTNKQLAQSGNFQSASRPSFMLLDQVGKPVYLGSVLALNWWSVDITYPAQAYSSSTNEPTPPASNQVSSFYATSMNAPDKLFKYSSLADLLKDSVSANKSQAQQTGATSRSVYKLKHNMFGDSRLIVGGRFLYVSLLSSIGDDELLHRSSSSLESAQLVLVDLDNDDYQYLKLDSSSLSDSLAKQPLDLGDDYKLSRVEIASDENGVWLIIPTIEQKLSKGHLFASQPHRATQSTLLSSSPRKIVERRLHALKLRLPSQSRRENGDSNTITNISIGSNNRSVEIEYHVSMKLDWRMIGQMFIIDGVLYGIKDRHLYSSKLQFAYDLYKCKLLSTEYLTEPHRTFTNHFGNTQMIKYNPNEPKRLYTIDSGNLLWCPVKLIKTKPDDIWH